MVHVPHLDPHIFKISGQILRHLFCQGGYQHALTLFHAGIDFGQQIINLSVNRTNIDFRIDQSGRSDDLFHNTFALFLLERSRGRTDKNHLIEFAVKLIKGKWAVIKGRRQAESIIYQILLSCLISRMHSANLWQGNVGLVHKQ